VSLVVTWLESRLESERVAIETLTSSLLLQLKPQVDERDQPMTEPQLSYGT
ncbi:MAG: MotA/TolQ/ExbB proton channel family protein, partial [Roseibium sp.]|nr:MotA/TolQ/ExbB proton channel family protein [Roseibium sp.]